MFFNLIYGLGLLLLSPMVIYRMLRHGRYLEGWRDKLWGVSEEWASEIRGDASELIWCHAVSVGEVQLLPELIRRIRGERPDTAIVVSCGTDSGMTLARRHFGDSVMFCPLDFTWSVRHTLESLRPDQLILMELELWPNLIRLARQSGCRVNVVNGRLSQKSCDGYVKAGRIIRPTFARLNSVGCQDSSSANAFVRCGVDPDKVFLTGSLKFDNAPHCRDAPEVTERVNWSGAEPWHRIWCFGSTQVGEELMAIRTYDKLREEHPELRLILAPRHAERFDAVAKQIQETGHRVIRRSDDDSQYADVWDNDEIILVDTLGELRAWWGVAEIATVGGSFGNRGGQNMIEPAGYGCAVSFGPNTTNFASIANELVTQRAAIRVADGHELTAFVRRCLDDPPACDRLGQAARAVVHAHRGAHDKTMQMLREVPSVSLPPTVETRRAA
ncbi:MAG: glycosyltransferase N-terminal domain-containing protein [Planctomycetota bacterium]